MGGVIVVFICVFGAIIWGVRAGKKRNDPLTLLAEKLGLNFNHERNYPLEDPFSFLTQLHQGANRYTFNRLRGSYQEHEVAVFDAHYETESTDSDRKQKPNAHPFSFFTLTLPKDIDELMISPASSASKIPPSEGVEAINMESSEFSNTFVVHAKNEKFAHTICHARMMEYLLAHPDLTLEINRNLLAISYPRRLEVEAIEPHLKHLLEIRNLLSDHLFKN
ncbi:MAG: hypothetical protein V5783_07630 [Pontiella sp.]